MFCEKSNLLSNGTIQIAGRGGVSHHDDPHKIFRESSLLCGWGADDLCVCNQ